MPVSVGNAAVILRSVSVRHREHDLSDVTLCGEGLLSRDDLLQRVHGRDQRPEFAPREVANEVRKDVRVKHRATEQAQIFQVERAEVEWHHRSPNRSSRRIAAEGSEHLKKLRPRVTTDHIDDDVERVSSTSTNDVFRPIDGLDCTYCEHFGVGVGSGHCDDMGTSSSRQLNCCRPNPSGGTGDQNPFARRYRSPRHHVLRGRVRTGERRQFDVGQRALNPPRMTRRGSCVLGEGSVDLGPEVTNRSRGRPKDWFYNHAFTDPLGRDVRTDGNDMATRVGTLDAGKFRHVARPTNGVVTITVGLAVPPHPSVEVGVVHPCRRNPYQHIIGAGRRGDDIITPAKLFEATVAHEMHGTHVSRNHRLILTATRETHY